MIRTSLFALAIVTSASAASATTFTIDLSDGVFTEVTPSACCTDQPVVFSETAGGVTFTFTALNNLVGETRFIGLTGTRGMAVGGGGGSTLQFALAASEDVDLESYTTGVNNFFLNAGNLSLAIYEGIGTGGTLLSSGNAMTASATPFTFAGGAIALMGGDSYTFNLTGTGAAVQSFFASMDFTKTSGTGPTPIPLPAAGWLMLAGLGGLGLAARRRNQA